MDYEKLTKNDLVRIIEGIRSPRYTREKSDAGYLTRILEALLLERYEIESQMHAMKESLLEIEKSLQEHIDLFDKAPAAYITLNSIGCSRPPILCLPNPGEPAIVSESFHRMPSQSSSSPSRKPQCLAGKRYCANHVDGVFSRRLSGRLHRSKPLGKMAR